MNTIITREICSGVNFTYIPEKKFKTASICFSLFTPLDEECVSQNALIPFLLTRSCKKHPSFLSLNKRLEELYGAHVTAQTQSLGEAQLLSVTIQSIKNDFTGLDSDNIAQVANLLCDMIFEPNVTEDAFSEEDINQEKRQLIEDILSEINDKKAYAQKRCKETMCKNEKFGINALGNVQDVKNLDGKTVFKAYKKLLNSSQIEIIMVGFDKWEPIFEEFKIRFSKIKRYKTIPCETKITAKVNHVTEINEIMDVEQCKLVMGMRTQIAKPNSQVESMKVANALLGETSQSKLFINVRENLSLCYYCSSKYDSQKGVLFISSGVQKNNIERAKKEILKQLEDIKLGNFNEKELEETKLYMAQNAEKVKDSLGALTSFYCRQTFDKTKISPEESIKKIKSVTREQVIAAAQKILLDTVYVLSGKEGKNETENS